MPACANTSTIFFSEFGSLVFERLPHCSANEACVSPGAFAGGACTALENTQGRMDITQLVRVVDRALHGCPTPVAPAAATPARLASG